MISGLQKMTLVDFPGKVACTVFLSGCNYRCPFCHNSELFLGKPETIMSEEDLIRFLDGRQGLLDGVCVSGGEPTLYPGLESFLKSVKELGFLVKLDTNGTRPKVLKALVEKGLLDYVAVDAKNSPQRYAATVGVETDLEPVAETLRFLLEDRVDYELRTTLVKPLHDCASIEDMGKWLASLVPGRKPRKLYLQRFVDRETVLFSGLSAPESDEVDTYVRLLQPYVEEIFVRN